MNNKQERKDIIPLRDLNLTSRFLFDQVMEERNEDYWLSIV